MVLMEIFPAVVTTSSPNSAYTKFDEADAIDKRVKRLFEVHYRRNGRKAVAS
jgi:hypothetical protein